MSKLLAAFTALSLIAVASCADLRDLSALQQDLAREFHHAAVNVNVNNGAYLTVVFQNSQFPSLPDSERAAFARRVAVFVRDHLRGYPRLQSVSVGFASRTGVGPVSYTKSEIPYRFAVAELGSASDTTRTQD